MLYSLEEACARLGMDFKTLHRRLKEAGITPVQDETDKRRRLLSDEQLAQIPAARRRETIQTMRDELAEATQQIKVLEQRLHQTDRQLLDLREDYRVLRSTVLAMLRQMTVQSETLPHLPRPDASYPDDQPGDWQ